MILKRKNRKNIFVNSQKNSMIQKLVQKRTVFFCKTLYNGKRISLVPPILVDNKIKANFKEKTNHFNDFFASQCTPNSNDSTLPNTTNSVSNISLPSIQSED